MNLPSQFLQRMRAMLGSEYDRFEESFHRDRNSGLRVNLLKTSVENFQHIQPFSLKSIPWCDSGYYYNVDNERERGLRPGKHPLHEAGLYYIQEPSAMAVAEEAREEIARRPGCDEAERPLRVLDLCAAPGGKSSQLAAQLGGRGFLVSNEIHPARAKILSQNMERMGLTSGMVVSHSPAELSARFPQCFDIIIMDAPCSGEGMFRKDEDTVDQWSLDNVQMCAERQKDIFYDAFDMLAPGGVLIYSTCTFAPAENEGVVLWALREFPELEACQVSGKWAKAADAKGADSGAQNQARLFDDGHPEWACGEFGCGLGEEAGADEAAAIRMGARLWPQDLEGEGHFVARFRKRRACEVIEAEGDDDELSAEDRDRIWFGGKSGKAGKKKDKKAGKGGKSGGSNNSGVKPPAEWQEFAEEFFGEGLNGGANGAAQAALDRICGEGHRFLLFGDQLYAVNADCPGLDGLTVMRPGLHLGTLKKGRFEPSHALALAMTPAVIKDLALEDRCAELNDALAARYLKGEALADSELAAELQDGWNVVTYGGFALGWGKVSGGSVKNHYPKGLRWV